MFVLYIKNQLSILCNLVMILFYSKMLFDVFLRICYKVLLLLKAKLKVEPTCIPAAVVMLQPSNPSVFFL